MKLSRLTILATAAMLAGCASMNTWGTKVPMGEVKYSSVPTEHVMILFEPPKKDYLEIGLVSALGGVFSSDGDMFRTMQKKAAELGADAIVVRQGNNSTIKGSDGATVVQTQTVVKTGWDYPRTSALAIKYK
jgi:hypothetical protein